MNIERDKYLTEQMGECWHELAGKKRLVCSKCLKLFVNHTDFSTWEGFGKLWDWSQKQEWWDTFVMKELHYSHRTHYDGVNYVYENRLDDELVNPDRFADAVYEYLKEMKG